MAARIKEGGLRSSQQSESNIHEFAQHSGKVQRNSDCDFLAVEDHRFSLQVRFTTASRPRDKCLKAKKSQCSPLPSVPRVRMTSQLQRRLGSWCGHDNCPHCRGPRRNGERIFRISLFHKAPYYLLLFHLLLLLRATQAQHHTRLVHDPHKTWE
jgi:hypothetical protein